MRSLKTPKLYKFHRSEENGTKWLVIFLGKQNPMELKCKNKIKFEIRFIVKEKMQIRVSKGFGMDEGFESVWYFRRVWKIESNGKEMEEARKRKVTSYHSSRVFSLRQLGESIRLNSVANSFGLQANGPIQFGFGSSRVWEFSVFLGNFYWIFFFWFKTFLFPIFVHYYFPNCSLL